MTDLKQFITEYAKKTTADNSRGTYVGCFNAIRLPPQKFELRERLVMPGYCELVGENTLIELFDDACLDWPDGYDVTVSRVRFLGGKTPIRFSNRNINGASLTLRDCWFNGHTSHAVATYLPDGIDHLSTQLRIMGGRILGGGAISTHCDQTVLEDVWIQPRDGFEGEVVIDNLAGDLYMQRTLDVPDFQTRKDVFWVRNAGDFYATHCRFSGEHGGIPIVWHVGRNLKNYPYMGCVVSIEHCQLSCGAKVHPKQCVIYLDGELPALTRIIGNDYLVDCQYFRFGPSAKLPADQKPPPRIRPQIRVSDNMAFAATIQDQLKAYWVL